MHGTSAEHRHDATSPELRAQQYGASTGLRHDATFWRTCLYSYGTSAELRHDATSTELRAQWPHLYVFSPRRCVNGLRHQWGTVHGDDGVGHPIAERGPLVLLDPNDLSVSILHMLWGVWHPLIDMRSERGSHRP
jgi:hypothetical protein